MHVGQALVCLTSQRLPSCPSSDINVKCVDVHDVLQDLKLQEDLNCNEACP